MFTRCLIVFVFFHAALCNSLIEVLQQNGETTLISLLQKAGLSNTLHGGHYTIFAPTNAAFAKLPQTTLDALNKDTTALANLLKYHVIRGVVKKADVANELQAETLAGTKMRLNIYKHNNVITAEGSKITHFDLLADNGVVHVIDTIMAPPSGSIVDVVGGDFDLTTLLNQVKSAGLIHALQANNRTLFAPTNEAFAKLGQNTLNGLTSNAKLLKDILNYHVVPHTEYSSGLFRREHLHTLDTNHDTIRLRIHGHTVSVNNAHITRADISATNGVVHKIDHVLIPSHYLSSSILGK